MTDPFGFLRIPREAVPARPVEQRLGDWHEVYAGQALLPLVSRQADRCMDCGIPFCHTGCPLGNLIPEWNAYAARRDWRAAYERLHATNNFPEVTGRLCPAPARTPASSRSTPTRSPSRTSSRRSRTRAGGAAT